MTMAKSPAKIEVIKFVKETTMEDFYTFNFRGSLDDAKRFVHRMRVELSRMRDYVKSRGMSVKHFKMILIEYEEIEAGKRVKITLKKTQSARNVDNEIDEIMPAISGGHTFG